MGATIDNIPQDYSFTGVTYAITVARVESAETSQEAVLPFHFARLDIFADSISVNTVPEPGSLAFAAIGMAAMACAITRARRRG